MGFRTTIPNAALMASMAFATLPCRIFQTGSNFALAKPEEKCYEIVNRDPLLSDNFDEPKYPAQVSLWLAAGGQPEAPGYGLEDLTKFLNAQVIFSESPSPSCGAHITSIILVDCLFLQPI